MLYFFRSAATPEMVMLAPHASALLEAMGKEGTSAEGIITLAQLPQAIASLGAFMDAHKAQPPASVPDTAGNAAEEEAHTSEPGISLATRAQPLLDMLQRSLQAKEAVTWSKR